MQFKSTNRTLKNLKTDCLCISIFENLPLTDEQKEFDRENNKILSKTLKSKDFKRNLAETYLIPCQPTKKAKRILLIGLGKYQKLNARGYHQALNAMISCLKNLHLSDIAINFNLHHYNQLNPEWAVSYISELFIKRSYHFKTMAHQHFPDKYAEPELNKLSASTNIRLRIPFLQINISSTNSLLEMGKMLGESINEARFLADLPANFCTPSYLAEYCLKLAQQHSNLEVKVLHQADMQKLSMGALLSVSAGSVEAPKLIQIRYIPEKLKKNTTNSPLKIALVGKAVTFDTGGISLKPSASMDEMKFDMCGGASVIGIMQVLAKIKAVSSEVIGIIPATENMPSHAATKPGDVVKSMSGKTIEILNTDAEGRLILADALTYAQQVHQAELIIDIATLTGACLVALGTHRSGLMSNDSRLAASIEEMGDRVFDPCWRLPLDDPYGEPLDSSFADFANISSAKGAGTTVAGMFLQKFINRNSQWAHLDIAGTAWHSGKNKAATGRPIGLLSNWLLHNYSAAAKLPKINTIKSSKRGLIGPIIEKGLMDGDSTETIISNILKAAPTARTSASTITFYAHRLRKQGKPIPLRQRGRRRSND